MLSLSSLHLICSSNAWRSLTVMKQIYPKVSSPDKEQASINAAFYFIGFPACNLLINFLMVFFCIKAAKQASLCYSFLKYKLLDPTAFSCSYDPAFTICLFNKLDLIKSNAMNIASGCLLCIITFIF